MKKTFTYLSLLIITLPVLAKEPELLICKSYGSTVFFPESKPGNRINKHETPNN